MKKITLDISGMHCTSCAFNIDGELEDTNGIKSSATNYAKQQSTVEFDEQQLEIKEIQKIIEKLGYSASPAA